jgi:hypothetical protein
MKLIPNKGHFPIGARVRGTEVYVQRLNAGKKLIATVVEYTPANCTPNQSIICKCKVYGETITLRHTPYGTVVHCQHYPSTESTDWGQDLWELDENNNQ